MNKYLLGFFALGLIIVSPATTFADANSICGAIRNPSARLILACQQITAADQIENSINSSNLSADTANGLVQQIVIIRQMVVVILTQELATLTAASVPSTIITQPVVDTTPTISSISPESILAPTLAAPSSQVVTIKGSNFTADTVVNLVDSSYASYPNVQKVVLVDSQTITFQIVTGSGLPNVSPGAYWINLSNFSTGQSNYVLFAISAPTISAEPVISSVSLSSTQVGETITIKGTDFVANILVNLVNSSSQINYSYYVYDLSLVDSQTMTFSLSSSRSTNMPFSLPVGVYQVYFTSNYGRSNSVNLIIAAASL